MNERPSLWAGLTGIGLVALCCGAPLLIGAIGVLSVSALARWATHVILPTIGLLVVVAGLVLYFRFCRAHVASQRCDDSTGIASRNL